MANTSLIKDQRQLAEWIRDTKGPVDLAVAFWGPEAIDELGLRNGDRPTRILLELSAGGTNPDAVRKLRELQKLGHVKLKQLPRLHAKAYISAKGVVIGSANASANGLGAEGTVASQWHELGCFTDDERVVREAGEWFERKWAEGQPISCDDVDEAELRWRSRQRMRPWSERPSDRILEAAEANPSDFRNRGIYVVVTHEYFDERGERDAADFEHVTGKEALAWQEWWDIPRNAKLICFTDYDGRDFRWDVCRVCYSPAEPNRHGSLFLVSRSWLGHGFKLDGIAAWRKALRRAAMSEAKWSGEGVWNMDLGDFAEKFGNQGDPKLPRRATIGPR